MGAGVVTSGEPSVAKRNLAVSEDRAVAVDLAASNFRVG